MKFILTCGGTAGHINPALAVAGRLRELMPDSEFLFLGAEGKMEMELVPREGYEIRPLKITNISRGRSLSAIGHNLSTVKNVIASERQAKKIIQDFQPDAVIGTGGYVCYPVLMAASRLHIPTLVHESNAAPGLTTRLLAEHVDRILVGFEESRQHYPNPERVAVTGTPVRGEFARYTQRSAKEELGLDPEQPLVVSVWGSLGSGHMNQILTEMLPLMERQREFRLIHSIGSRDYAVISEKLQAAGNPGGGLRRGCAGVYLRYAARDGGGRSDPVPRRGLYPGGAELSGKAGHHRSLAECDGQSSGEKRPRSGTGGPGGGGPCIIGGVDAIPS